MIIKNIPLPSANYELNRRGEKIEFIVLHWSPTKNIKEISSDFINPNRLASAHYAVEDETIYQFVKDEQTAFHSGKAIIDHQSIGIICVNQSEKTISTVCSLIEELCRKYAIPVNADTIKRHSDFTESQCPGDLNVEGIITGVKRLSPQSLLEKIHLERDDFALKYKNEKQETLLINAKLEELRRLLVIRDDDYALLLRENMNLEKQYELQKNKSIFAIIWERIRRK